MTIRHARPLRTLAAGDARRHQHQDPGEQAEADRVWLEQADERLRRNLEVVTEIRELLEELTTAEAELAPLAARFGPRPANPKRMTPPTPVPKKPAPRRRRPQSPFILVSVRLPGSRNHALVLPPSTPGGTWVVLFPSGPAAYPEAPTAIEAAQQHHASSRKRLETAQAAALKATDRLIAARKRVEARLVWLSE